MLDTKDLENKLEKCFRRCATGMTQLRKCVENAMDVGFTKEEADKIRAKNPLIFFREAPTGSIKELPKLGSILEMSSIGLTLTSSRMPEDVGYRVIKALHQNWGEVAKGYPPVGAFDPIADFIKAIPQGLEVPLHTGVVRYAKEIGIEIPKPFIPPEYKGAK